MFKFIKKLWEKNDVRYSCYGIEIPKYCIGDAINSYKHEISKNQQKKVRDWYLKNLPKKCETIINVHSNWIGGSFGTKYYSASSIDKWNGFRLYVGENIYVELY